MTGVSKDLWQPGHFADICTMDRKSIGSTSGGNLPYLGLDLVESQTGEILAFSDEAPVGNSFLFGPQHVLYGKLRPYLNKVAVPDCSGKCSTELVPLLPRNGVDRDYLAHALRCQRVVNSVMEKNTGARMPRTDMKYLMSLPLLIPPLDEQRRIVDILKRADSIRRLRKQALETTREMIPALFVDMFGDPATNPKGLRVEKIGAVTQIKTGSTPSREITEYYTGKIPWVKTAEVNGTVIYDTEEHISEKAIADTNCKVFPQGTVLIAMYGQGLTRGRSGILATPSATNQACAAVLPSDQLDEIFLFYQMQVQYSALRALGHGGNQPNLNLGMVKSFPILVPSMESQKSFSKKASNLISIITMQEAHFLETTAIVQSLMAQFFG